MAEDDLGRPELRLEALNQRAQARQLPDPGA